MLKLRHKLRRAWHELFGHGKLYETFSWTQSGVPLPGTLVDGWRQWRCGCGAVSHQMPVSLRVDTYREGVTYVDDAAGQGMTFKMLPVPEK